MAMKPISYSFFCFKQKTAYEMRISDWSSDVCSSDLFKYLSGCVEPDAVLVIAPGRKADGHAAEFVMFVRARDTDMEIWHGRRAGPEGAVHDYGADEAFTIDEFATELPQLLAGRKQVHYTMGEHPHLDATVAACVREIREVSRRGAAAPTDFVALATSLHEMRLKRSAPEPIGKESGGE